MPHLYVNLILWFNEGRLRPTKLRRRVNGDRGGEAFGHDGLQSRGGR